MSEHFSKSRAIHLIDIIRRYWAGHGKVPRLEAVSDPIAGYVVRSNMLNGKPVSEDRSVYVPVREVRLNKRVK